MTNRELVVKTIRDAGDAGLRSDEVVELTGLDRWVVVACIWLSMRELDVVRPVDPVDGARWRFAEPPPGDVRLVDHRRG